MNLKTHYAWNTMETAPKDGRELLAFGTMHGTYGYTEDVFTWTGIKWFSPQGYWSTTKATAQYFTGFTPKYWTDAPILPDDLLKP